MPAAARGKNTSLGKEKNTEKFPERTRCHVMSHTHIEKQVCNVLHSKPSVLEPRFTFACSQKAMGGQYSPKVI